MESITVTELASLIKDPDAEIMIVDVREDWEYQLCHIEDCIHIPMGTIPASLDKLEFNLPIIVYCHHGMRSQQVGMFLQGQGFNHVLNLEGGIDAWARLVDTSMSQY